jgi:DNA-binding NtrC family response regulator
VRTGACDFIAKPFKTQDLVLAIERALRERTMRREIVRLRRRLGEDEHGDLVARSPAMRRVVEIARRASRSKANVLITGDSGTGKSAVARWIHHHGDRRDGPFVHVRCATLPAVGTDVELFGRRGASSPEGLFAEASGGTLLLDEICELSPEGQRALLEALEHAKLAERPDTRVIATTNRALAESIRTGKLSRELSYALNVIPIHVPPLRERAEDLPELVRQLLARTPDRAIGITDPALQRLVEAQWAGNVRELASVLERVVALSESDTLTVDDLEREQTASPEPVSALMGSVAERQLSLAEVERGYIQCVLEHTSRNITRTARILGIDRRTLHRKLASLD